MSKTETTQKSKPAAKAACYEAIQKQLKAEAAQQLYASYFTYGTAHPLHEASWTHALGAKRAKKIIDTAVEARYRTLGPGEVYYYYDYRLDHLKRHVQVQCYRIFKHGSKEMSKKLCDRWTGLIFRDEHAAFEYTDKANRAIGYFKKTTEFEAQEKQLKDYAGPNTITIYDNFLALWAENENGELVAEAYGDVQEFYTMLKERFPQAELIIYRGD